MPNLSSEGFSQKYIVLSDTGAHVSARNVSGAITFEQFDGGTSSFL